MAKNKVFIGYDYDNDKAAKDRLLEWVNKEFDCSSYDRSFDVAVDSEQRLGKTLLQLARTLGKKDQQSTHIEPKISHDELSEMVGTTRPRISLFMQRFRNLGLIETNLDRFLVINEKKLTDYLARIAIAPGHHRGSRDDSCQTRPILNRNRSRVGITSKPNGGNLLWD